MCETEKVTSINVRQVKLLHIKSLRKWLHKKNVEHNKVTRVLGKYFDHSCLNQPRHKFSYRCYPRISSDR